MLGSILDPSRILSSLRVSIDGISDGTPDGMLDGTPDGTDEGWLEGSILGSKLISYAGFGEYSSRTLFPRDAAESSKPFSSLRIVTDGTSDGTPDGAPDGSDEGSLEGSTLGSELISLDGDTPLSRALVPLNIAFELPKVKAIVTTATARVRAAK